MPKQYVVILDDQVDIRRLLRAAIETLGRDLEIIDVPSGEEALLVIAKKPMDLLIIDVNLPGISGLEVLQRARARNPQLRLILVTGATDPEIRKQVAEGKADAYFIKPIDMFEFLTTVENCLNRGAEEKASAGESAPATTTPKTAPIPTAEARVAQPTRVDETIPERLARLCDELNAQSILLLAEGGVVLFQAGELPDTIVLTSLVSPASVIFSLGAQIAGALETRHPENVLFFTGTARDLILSNVGDSMGVLIVLPGRSSKERLASIQTTLGVAIPELLEIADRTGLAARIQAERAVAVKDVGNTAELDGSNIDDEIDQILSQAAHVQIQQQTVDDFWESAIFESRPKGLKNTGALSYDQASKLGLTPDEK